MNWIEEIKDAVKTTKAKKKKLAKLGLVGLVIYYLFLTWMSLAAVLSFFASRALLVIFYFLIIVPIGLAMRFFKQAGKKEVSNTYWIKHHG